jgi:hypothetical protein
MFPSKQYFLPKMIKLMEAKHGITDGSVFIPEEMQLLT